MVASVKGLRLNRFGQLNLNDVERPQGGGLDVLAMKLHCRAVQVQSIQLGDWLQVWVNADKVGTDTNPVLSKMVTALAGQPYLVGGAGLFLATIPGTWTVTGLSPEQQSKVREVWEQVS